MGLFVMVTNNSGTKARSILRTASKMVILYV